ncbi:TetR family transcriptional regulator [Massilia sp. KIM]|uniref:TetR family transcriptional regulator n=1 Tax=Massilia sp. KIM TaxID=1955422 RepID=UPI00098FA261|nr:TetR family transcriptional regulator [Massilia sp. KIM]OON61086.1 TetR family transcriptional regulator [Massilia sp. KIM]
MARRTKEEAAATRDSILDAAEILFAKQGVSRTTLQHIASAAGVTRGAIYWHFLDKGALFNAMMDRAKSPIEEAMQLLQQREVQDPLQCLRDELVTVLRITAEDEKARRVFEIATLKTEFLDDVDSVRARRSESIALWRDRMEEHLQAARDKGMLREDVLPRTAATGGWIIVDGLIRNWIFEPSAFDLLDTGGQVIDIFLQGLRRS